MKKIKLEEIKNSRGSTNWEAIKNQSDSDIERAAKNSDAKLFSEIELSQFRTEKDKKN
ncbi:hypothetical protein [Microbulbifer variabilis]|uniref:hypothetical protein n=1 Tax=Microbulbifer variabilis TaxID=266805 RepID=UPI001CFC7C28|nr:hypothetical protein [Microbulbifer variabilis]